MNTTELLRYGKTGLNTLVDSITFFYRHVSLLIISLDTSWHPVVSNVE